jgi:hypothetical protein
MKTDGLIRALAADASRPIKPLGHYLWAGALSGTLLAVILFVVSLHARADLSQALRSPAFVYKIIVAASLALSAGWLLTDVGRPLQSHAHRRFLLILAPTLLALGIGVELWTQPAALWLPRLIGHNAAHCLSLIPFLAAGPAVCLFVALRHGAPARPASAGAVAGLVSSGVGAVLYALTCPDDSPLFVATWYTLATAIVTGAAAYAGNRLLRW